MCFPRKKSIVPHKRADPGDSIRPTYQIDDKTARKEIEKCYGQYRPEVPSYMKSEKRKAKDTALWMIADEFPHLFETKPSEAWAKHTFRK